MATIDQSNNVPEKTSVQMRSPESCKYAYIWKGDSEVERAITVAPKHLDIVMDTSCEELFNLLVELLDPRMRDLVPLFVSMAASVGPNFLDQNFRRWCFRQGIDECHQLVNQQRNKFEFCARLLTPSALAGFTDLLCYGAPITKLDLSGSDCALCDPYYSELLGDALYGNDDLKTLRLSNCGITNESAEILLTSLATCEKIRDIDLSFNPFGGYAIEFVAEALYENPAIRCVHLEGVYFGNEAAEMLLHALEARGDVYVELSLEYFEHKLEEEMFERLRRFQMDKFSYLDYRSSFI